MSMLDRLANDYLHNMPIRVASKEEPNDIKLPEKWAAWHGGLNIHAFLRDQKYDSKALTSSKTDDEYVSALAEKCANDDLAPVQAASNRVRDFKRAYRYGLAAEDSGNHRVAQLFFDRCRSLIMGAIQTSPDDYIYPKGYHPTKSAVEIHRDSYPHAHSELTNFVTAQGEADKTSSDDMRKVFLSRADLSAAERRRIRQMSASEFGRLVDAIKADTTKVAKSSLDWKDLLTTRYSKVQLAPERKDHQRIQDIVDRNTTDEKMNAAASRMAKSITDAAKAYRRARAAEDINFHDMAKIFDDRAKAIVGLW